MVTRFDYINYDTRAMTLPWLIFYLAFFILWGGFALWLVNKPSLSWYDLIGVNSFALFIAYVWIGSGGALATMPLAEWTRWLFSRQMFLPLSSLGAGPILRENPQRRMGPRVEPLVTGVIERLIFTTIGTFLLSVDDGKHVGSLAVIAGGYIALKAIKRTRSETSEQSINVSIHSIWGSSISVGFGILGAFYFHKIA